MGRSITVLKSKLHFVRVTSVQPDYEGSLGIDSGFMETVHLRPYEQIDIYNCNNGARITTYAIPLNPGSKCIQVNGAACHHFSVGDKIIVVSYQHIDLDLEEGASFITYKALFEDNNHLKESKVEHH
jgi:aspartate 1-decarboxylase